MPSAFARLNLTITAADLGAPDVLRSFGVVVRSKKKVDEGRLYAIGPRYREYGTMYPLLKS
jgi:hypothetical protein